MTDKTPMQLDTDVSADDDDLRLAPLEDQPQYTPSPAIKEVSRNRPNQARTAGPSRYRRNPHAALYGADSSASRSANRKEGRLDVSRQPDLRLDTPMSRRDYKTIRSLQKFLRSFAYATIVAMPLFLIARLVLLVFFSTDDLGDQFPAFLLYAFWILAGAAFVYSVLLAGTELLQILIVVQSDTLAESEASFSDRSEDLPTQELYP